MFKIIRSVPLLAFFLILVACQTAVVEQTGQTVPAPAMHSKMHTLKASFKLQEYSVLPGWYQDNLTEVWPALRASCSVLVNKPLYKSRWQAPCAAALGVDGQDNLAVRNFFETFFNPWQVINPDETETGLVTGYYEPLLTGSRVRKEAYQTPLHQVPSDLLTIDLGSVFPELKGMRLRGRIEGKKVVPYPARAGLLQSNELNGMEICWVDNSVDAFFLQVQGSGRVYFPESDETVRLAYADQNGQPYKSIGRYLVDKGELKLEKASAQGIKNWIAKNPSREDEVLNSNPSYVFFKEEKLINPEQGPKGALGVALSAKRSIAVDASYLPLGAPVFIKTTEPDSTVPINRLVMAQDTGGAIRGAVRADYFWGFGAQAGEMAGRMKQRGMLWVLWPKLAGNPLEIHQ